MKRNIIKVYLVDFLDAVNYNNNKENQVLKERLAKFEGTKNDRQIDEFVKKDKGELLKKDKEEIFKKLDANWEEIMKKLTNEANLEIKMVEKDPNEKVRRRI